MIINKGQIIGRRYKVLSSIGEGGMADVYLVYDTIIGRNVAMKILRRELSKDPVVDIRFQREAQACVKMSHPNIVNVYDVGEEDGLKYIVMEYIKGRTLKQLISLRGALYVEEALDIMIPLTKAVLHAHEHGIIHRDIKPQNILVKDDGTIKITDFGIALSNDAINLTPSESVLGSAHYLAPEATKGEEVGFQVDIYALGIVFYELLSGKVPFKGDNPVNIAIKHLHDEIPSIRDFNPDIPQSVENIITLATAKDLKQRYQSAKEMLYDLEHCLQNPNVAKIVLKNNEVKQAKEVKEIKKSDVKKTSNKKVNKKQKNNNKLVMIVSAGLIIIALIVGIIFMQTSSVEVPHFTDYQQDAMVSQLIDAGFKADNIVIKEEYSDTLETGEFIKINYEEGSKVDKNKRIVLTFSKGKNYVVEDYVNQKYETVLNQLSKQAPNIKVEVEYRQTTNKKAGYIIEQSGIALGSVIAPNEEVKIKFVVTSAVEFEIRGIVGLKVEDAQNYLQQKGIYPVLYQLVKEDGIEYEEGVVVDVDPAEGSWYKQEGNNTITLYYY